MDGVFLKCIDKNVTISDSNEICENDARYFGGRHDYYCNCTKGWTGKNCDKPSKFFSKGQYVLPIKKNPEESKKELKISKESKRFQKDPKVSKMLKK